MLNIFLRDCLYTTYIEEAFHLRRCEIEFELPLDSITAKALKQSAGRGTLPLWPGVKHLTPGQSLQFQSAAKAEAQRQGVSRVHLDAVWWSVSRDQESGSN